MRLPHTRSLQHLNGRRSSVHLAESWVVVCPQWQLLWRLTAGGFWLILSLILAVHERDVLAHVLGVVSWVRLVGDQLHHPPGRDRQLVVDLDGTAQPASVPRVARPRLSPRDLKGDGFFVGQAPPLVSAMAQLASEGLQPRD
jgi:hypothetical protein